MARTRWLYISLLVLATTAFAVALYVSEMETGVLFLSPAIVLLASLLTGRYVGERGLARLVAARHRGRRPRLRAVNPLAHVSGRARMPRGGRLVATSLTVRPPPAPAFVP